jgi:[Skp1-protein]-hydroxyproline N-acetylglucosaminyltransferase
LFFGEEMGMLVRMWTSGWDVFAPGEVFALHRWSRSYRHTFDKDITQVCLVLAPQKD